MKHSIDLGDKMNHRVYITGASGSGVTTLGCAISKKLKLVHVDCDNHYWLDTDPPFTEKRPSADRISSINSVLGRFGWVLTGSLVSWGTSLVEKVDVIVYVSTPTELRIQRLVARERQRFGNRIDIGGDMHTNHLEFIEWAKGYDDPHFQSRSRARHENWLCDRSSLIIRVDGTRPVDVSVEEVIAELQTAGS